MAYAPSISGAHLATLVYIYRHKTEPTFIHAVEAAMTKKKKQSTTIQPLTTQHLIHLLFILILILAPFAEDADLGVDPCGEEWRPLIYDHLATPSSDATKLGQQECLGCLTDLDTCTMVQQMPDKAGMSSCVPWNA